MSYVEAISNSDTNHCHSAMDLEMNPMYKNYVQELIEAPNGIKSIGLQWIFKPKKNANETCESLQNNYGGKWL